MATKNLLESYRNRLSVADNVYAQTHNGAKMDQNKKLLIANSLNNVSKFLSEAFENSAGTQRAALGDYKLFCLTLTTLALPNMIAPELVLTVPMASRTGRVAYLEYVAGSNKGGVSRGDMFNSVWSLGEMTDDRVKYTGQKVVETITAGDTTLALAWEPVVGTIVVKNKTTGVALVEGTDYTVATGTYDKRMQLQDGWDNQGASILVAPNDVNDTNHAVGQTFITLTAAQANDVTVAYEYDNIVIPQNDIPQLNARMNEVTLEAKARRIAVYYSQIANFQAKTDYGFDLGDNLAKQAIGELTYEIDSEIVAGLRDGVKATDFTTNVWSKTLPIGVSKLEHYAGFAEAFDTAAATIYQRTQKFTPNYMVCARDVVTVLMFLNGWHAANVTTVNGPYFAGDYAGVKVYVSPMLNPGEYFFGVNGNDLMTSAAVYGVYMPIVPTQLLGFADGAMSQGFSTLYDFKLLSTLTETVDGVEHKYSPLLVGGKIIA